MYGLVKAMIPIGSSKRPAAVPDLPVTPEALFRLELLLGRHVMDLRAISEVVTSDIGLLTHVLRLARDMDSLPQNYPSVEECIVEVGVEGLRDCLRKARLHRAN
jgi:HD-like signal output (HDOD) protein